jgi:type II secretory pathway component GspD/PulD (secretin)
MKNSAQTATRTRIRVRAFARLFSSLLLQGAAGVLAAQTAAPAATSSHDVPAIQTAQPGAAASAPAALSANANEGEQPRNADRRHAAKLYLESSKQFMDGHFEMAMLGFQKAVALDASNTNYRLAADVARSHAVTALVQEAAKDRLGGNDSAARAALSRALALDPTNPEVSQHLDELADQLSVAPPETPYEPNPASGLGDQVPLEAAPQVHSFHLHTDQRQIVTQVYQAYGIKAMIDDSVRAIQTRLDLDDATFPQARHAVEMLTNTFSVILDPRHALVAADTQSNRTQFIRQEVETVYLGGLTDTEMTDVETLAKNVFDIKQDHINPLSHSITLRAPAPTLTAFNTTMRSLLDGRSQVVLDVRMIQVAHTSNLNTGAQLPQTITAFNVYAEEQSLLNANQSLVQQIISSGLASPNDPLAILGILIASGQVSSPLLSNGFALFGGGITQSALSPGPATFNLSLNSSDSRELDQIQLRLGDGEQGTLKEGSRYPIQTSQFSSLSPNLPNIPGLTGAGSSSSLSSLLSSLTNTVPNIPMVQYQDLGLTINATPKVLRSDNVALTIDMKLDALSGTLIGGNPVLNSRSYKGVVTLKEGEAAVVATELDKSESHAVSGTPGISEIPGLNDLTGKDLEKNYATLVIVMTPHVIRGLQAAGRTAMMRVEVTNP